MRGYRSWFQADSVALSLGASVASTAVVQGLGFVRAIALTWLMPPEQYGLFGVALLVINLLLPVAALGLYEGIARYAPQHEVQSTLPRFVFRAGAALVGTATVLMAVLALAAEAVGAGLFSPTAASGAATPTDPATLVRAVAASVVTLAAYHGLLGMLRGLRMFRASSLMEAAAAILTTGLLLALAWLGEASAAGLVLGYAGSIAGMVVIFAPGVWSAIRTSSHGPPAAEFQALHFRPAASTGILEFSLWSACGALVWHLLFYYPAWQVLRLAGEEPVAVFHATRMLAQLLLLAAVMVSGVVAACVNQLWETRQRVEAIEAYVILARTTGVLLLAGACGLALAWPVAMKLLPAVYADGGRIFPALALFFFLISVARLSNVGCQLIERPRIAFGAWAAGLAACAACMTLWPSFAGEGSPPSAGDTLVLGAWSSVLGAAVALVITLGATHARGIRLDVRLVILCLASWGVAASPTASGILLGALVLAMGIPGVILSREERGQLRGLLFKGGRAAVAKDR